MQNFNIIFYGETLYVLSAKLILGAVAAFLAILFWRKTRNPAEVLFIIGILFSYVSVLHKALRHFGFFVITDFVIADKIPITAIFDTVPIIFFIISLLLFLKKS